MQVFKRPLTLRLAHSRDRYLSIEMLHEAASNPWQYSSQMVDLIQRFITEEVRPILADAKRHPGQTQFPYTDPEDDLRRSLAVWRYKNYGSLNELASLFADNIMLWKAPLTYIAPKKSADDHTSLSSYIYNAIDRVILIEVRTWWNQQKDAPPLSENLYARTVLGSADKCFYPFDPVAATILHIAAEQPSSSTMLQKIISKMPFNSAAMTNLTKRHLTAMQQLAMNQPNATLWELHKSVPQKVDQLSAKDVKNVLKDEASLLLMNVYPIAEELGSVTLGALVIASIESALDKNIKALANETLVQELFSGTENPLPPVAPASPSSTVELKKPKRPTISFVKSRKAVG